MKITTQEIAESVCYNTTPSVEDGISNYERLQYALKVFNLEYLKMDSSFPFEQYLESDHLSELIAAKCVCSLHHSFNWALFLNGDIEKRKAEITSGYLQMMAMKLQWKIKFFDHEFVPPYNFIN